MAVAAERSRDKYTTLLDEEFGELESLDSSLKAANNVSTTMVGILNSFDTRLGQLETSVLPIHRSTQNLTRLAGNMNKTVAALEAILSYFDMAAQEEKIIMNRVTENDLQVYLQSIVRIREALKTLSAIKLKASERVVSQLRQSLKVAILQLETLFKKHLTENSQPLPLKIVTSTDRKDIPGLPPKAVQTLTTITSFFGSDNEGRETPKAIDAGGYLQIYCEIRAQCMIKSLTPLYQASVEEQRSVYEKGSSAFIPYTTSLLKLCRNEADLADTLLEPKLLSLAFTGSIMPPIEQWVETGKGIIKRVKRNYANEVWVLFDLVENLESNMNTFESVFGLARKQKENDAAELMKSFKAAAMRSFIDFLNDLRNPAHPKYVAMPMDGTVHQLTSDTLNYIKRLLNYPSIVESVLTLIGDGNWNNPEAGATGVGVGGASAAANNRKSQMARSTTGGVLQHYVADALEALVQTIEQKSKLYKKGQAIGTLFLLNNFYYISKSVKTHPKLLEVMTQGSALPTITGLPGAPPAGMTMVTSIYEKPLKQNVDLYQDNWKPCVEHLMDVTYVHDGDVQHVLNSNQRQLIKDKFKNFNHDFEELWKVQKQYSIPDLELRQLVLKDVHQVLIPMYERFLNKYGNGGGGGASAGQGAGYEFTKNIQKYIRYDVSMVRDMVQAFFTNT